MRGATGADAGLRAEFRTAPLAGLLLQRSDQRTARFEVTHRPLDCLPVAVAAREIAAHFLALRGAAHSARGAHGTDAISAQVAGAEHANDQSRMRLNLIAHLLSQVPYRRIKTVPPPFPPLTVKPGIDRPWIRVRWVPSSD